MSNSHLWRSLRRLLLLSAFLVATLPPPLGATLLITTSDGGMLHADSYETEGNWVRIHLQGGAAMMLPLKRIERVVDERPEEEEEAQPLKELALERVALRFDGTYGVPPTPHGKEIFDAAASRGVDVAFEASVGGGIPILRSMREGLAANRIQSLHGIMNGTTNYVLDRMAGGATLELDSASTGDLGAVEIDGETYTLADVGSGQGPDESGLIAVLVFQSLLFVLVGVGLLYLVR